MCGGLEVIEVVGYKDQECVWTQMVGLCDVGRVCMARDGCKVSPVSAMACDSRLVAIVGSNLKAVPLVIVGVSAPDGWRYIARYS